VLKSIINNITKILKNNDKLSLIGFGAFEVEKRATRNRRDPQAGEVVAIAE
jgi:DNA-binding protein HU-beta